MARTLSKKLGIFSLLLYGLLAPLSMAAASVSGSGAGGGLPFLNTQNSSMSLPDYLGRIRDYLLGFSGAIAVLFIVWGGLQYVASAGNEEKAKKAKATLTYAIIGLILILLAQVIFNLITGDLLSSIFTKSAPY